MTKMSGKRFMAVLEDKIVVRDMNAETTEAMQKRLIFFEELLGCKKCVICQGNSCPNIGG